MWNKLSADEKAHYQQLAKEHNQQLEDKFKGNTKESNHLQNNYLISISKIKQMVDEDPKLRGKLKPNTHKYIHKITNAFLVNLVGATIKQISKKKNKKLDLKCI